MKNKSIIRIICLWLFVIPTITSAQSYTAIHVIGDIYLPAKDAMLKRGDRIAESEQLEFRSADAKAAMLSSTRGRYVIQPGGADNADAGNLSFVLSSVITPARGQMSTRAGGINNKLDFEKKLGEQPVAWLGDELSYEVSPTAYPINDNQFFYANYQYRGESINKRLLAENNTLLLLKSQFFAVDGQPIDPSAVSQMVLYYYDMAEETATEITDMKLVPVSDEALTALQEAVADLPEENRIAALTEYVNSLYGMASAEQVQKALTAIK